METVLGVTDTGRLGGAAARLDVDSADLLDTDSRAPDVVSDGSRLWFVHESDYGEYVLVEVVDGHALPAAVLSPTRSTWSPCGTTRRSCAPSSAPAT